MPRKQVAKNSRKTNQVNTQKNTARPKVTKKSVTNPFSAFFVRHRHNATVMIAIAIIATAGGIGFIITSGAKADGGVSAFGISGPGDKLKLTYQNSYTTGTYVSLKEVYDTASRATKSCKVPAKGVTISQGFCWKSSYYSGGSNGKWTQQGITGNAYAEPKYAEINMLLVSSYREKGNKTNGSRIAVVNLDKGDPVYEEVILASKCSSTCKSMPSHTGGLAWVNNYLYVANTNSLLVFDTNKVIARASGGKTTYYLPLFQKWSLQNQQKVSGNTTKKGSGCTTLTPKISSISYNPTDQSIYSAEYVAKGDDCKNRNTTDVLVWNLRKDGSGLLPIGAANRDTDSILKFELPKDPQNINGIGVNGDLLLMNETYGTDTVVRFTIDRSRGDAAIQILSTLDPLQTPQGNGEGIYIDTAKNLVWSLTEKKNPGAYVYSYALSDAAAQ